MARWVACLDRLARLVVTENRRLNWLCEVSGLAALRAKTSASIEKLRGLKGLRLSELRSGSGSGDAPQRQAVETLEPRLLFSAELSLASFYADGELKVDYDVAGQDAQAFDVSVYRSGDGVSLDALVGTKRVDVAADLAVGSHTAVVDADFADVQEDYSLIAVVDSAGENAEGDETDNTAGFAGGVFVAADDVVHVHGESGVDTVNISQASNVNVTLNGAQHQIAAGTVGAIHLRMQGGDDTFYAGSGVIKTIWAFGGSGADDLTGGGVDAYLVGGSGDDTLTGRAGDDTLVGGAGADVLHGGYGADTLWGGDGDDSLHGNQDDDVVYGEAGNDTIDGDNGDDVIYGGAGDDNLRGNQHDDTIYGGDGNDVIEGGMGADTLEGGAGDDTIEGNQHADVIDGGAGNDFIKGGTGADLIDAGAGDDIIEGEQDPDTIDGGPGNDTIDAGAGNDTVWGGQGNDVIEGKTGADTLFGEGGDDIIDGDGGSDTLDGGTGIDTLDGVTESNTSPGITSPGLSDLIADTGFDPIDIDLYAAFEDAEHADGELSYALVGNTDPSLLASATIAGGVLTLVSAPGSSGQTALTVRATDTGGLWVEQTLTLTVTNPNTAPAPGNGGLPDQVVFEDADNVELVLSDYFDDAEEGASALTYEVVGNTNADLVLTDVFLPDGEIPSGAEPTLLIGFAPESSGSALLTLRATDSAGAWVESSFTVTVRAVDDAPILEGLDDGPDPAITGADLTLAVVSAWDDSAQMKIDFYRDLDNDGLLYASEDQWLGVDTDGGDGWSVTVSTEGFELGQQRYFAIATDSEGQTSNVITSTGGVGIVGILDQTQPGYSETGGGWSDAASSDSYGGTHRKIAPGTGASTANWVFTGLLEDAPHRVFVTWSADAGNATNATYTVSDDSGVLGTFSVDQTQAPDSFFDGSQWWQQLIEIPDVQGELTITLTDDADGVVVADAVRVLDPPPTIEYLSGDRAQLSAGTDLLLTAYEVLDTDGTVIDVDFYLDDGDGVFDDQSDTLIGTDAEGSDDYTAVFDTTGMTPDTYRFFAVAEDNAGEYSSPKSFDLSVSAGATGGMVVHYQFDEGSGSVVNDDATAEGAQTGSYNGPWAEGYSGGAINLNGVSQAVNITGYKGILGTNSRTVAAWINTTSGGAVTHWGATSTGGRWTLRVGNAQGGGNGALRLETSSGVKVGTTDLRDGQWHHVAVVYDSNDPAETDSIKFYIDGQLEIIDALPTSNAAFNTASGLDVRIGHSHSGKRFKGLIDDYRIYDTALTQAEVQSLAPTAPNTAPSVDDVELGIFGDGEIGQTLGTVLASDIDAGDTLTFSIESGNDDNVFAIDSATGTVTQIATPDFASQTDNQYKLTVKVTDDGTPQLYRLATVTVSELTQDSGLRVLLDFNDADADGDGYTNDSAASGGINAAQLRGGVGFAHDDFGQWSASFNGVTQDIELNRYQGTTGTQTAIGDVNRGVIGNSNGSGTAYLMYTAQNTQSRFTGISYAQADHLIVVQHNGTNWQYADLLPTVDDFWYDFTPAADDLLIAEITMQPVVDAITSLQGTSGTIEGIESGYAAGDLSFIAGLYDGQPSNDEHFVEGNYFIRNADAQTFNYAYKGVTGDQSRTVSAWVKTTRNGAVSQWGQLANGKQWTVRIGSPSGDAATDGMLRLEVGGGFVIGSTDLRDNQWHHLAVTFDNDGSPSTSDVKLYIDGIEETYTQRDDVAIDTGEDRTLRIGHTHFGTRFKGLMDEYRVYDRALSQGQIIGLIQDAGIDTGITTTVMSTTEGQAAVGTLTPTSPDPSADFNFTITAGDDNNLFAIDTDGNLTINDTATFDYEGTYQLTVQVTEVGAGTSLTVINILPNELVDGLIGLYQFNEGTGHTTEDLASANHATLTGTTEWQDSAVGSSAIAFNGINTAVTADGFQGINADNARTVSAWIKTTSTGPIVSWGSNTDGQLFNLRINDGSDGTIADTLRLDVGNGYITGSTILRDNNWHHVAVTFDPTSGSGTSDVTDAKLYVDGNLEAISASQSQALNSAFGSDVTFGFDPTGRRYEGLIDEIRIYDRALSDTEVATTASAPNSPAVIEGVSATTIITEGESVLIDVDVLDLGIKDITQVRVYLDVDKSGSLTASDPVQIVSASTNPVPIVLDASSVTPDTYTLVIEGLDASDAVLSSLTKSVLVLEDANYDPNVGIDIVSVTPDTPATFDLLGQHGDQAAAIANLGDPGNGGAVLNADGTITFTPDAGVGSTGAVASFLTYDVEDDQGNVIGSYSALLIIGTAAMPSDFSATGQASTDEQGNHSYTVTIDTDVGMDPGASLVVDKGDGSQPITTGFTDLGGGVYSATWSIEDPKAVKPIRVFGYDPAAAGGAVYQAMVTLAESPVLDVAIDVYSSTEANVRWINKAEGTTGSRVMVSENGGPFVEKATVEAGVSSVLLQDLEPGASIAVMIDPIFSADATVAYANASSSSESTDLDEHDPVNDAVRWFNVAVPDPQIQQGEAGFSSGENFLRIKPGTETIVKNGVTYARVAAASGEAAVRMALEGEAHIINFDNTDSFTYPFPEDDNFIVYKAGEVPTNANGDPYTGHTQINGQEGYLIVLEDSTEIEGYLDSDFDDWYWGVTVVEEPKVQVTINDASQLEPIAGGPNKMSFTIELVGEADPATPIKVQWWTIERNPISATDGSDYTGVTEAMDQIVTLTAGNPKKIVTIDILADNVLNEGAEFFDVKIKVVEGFATEAPDMAEGKIYDSDSEELDVTLTVEQFDASGTTLETTTATLDQTDVPLTVYLTEGWDADIEFIAALEGEDWDDIDVEYDFVKDDGGYVEGAQDLYPLNHLDGDSQFVTITPPFDELPDDPDDPDDYKVSVIDGDGGAEFASVKLELIGLTGVQVTNELVPAQNQWVSSNEADRPVVYMTENKDGELPTIELAPVVETTGPSIDWSLVHWEVALGTVDGPVAGDFSGSGNKASVKMVDAFSPYTINVWLDANDNGMLDTDELLADFDVKIVEFLSLTGRQPFDEETVEVGSTETHEMWLPFISDEGKLELVGAYTPNENDAGKYVAWKYEASNGGDTATGTFVDGDTVQKTLKDKQSIYTVSAWLDINLDGQYDSEYDTDYVEMTVYPVWLGNFWATDLRNGDFTMVDDGGTGDLYVPLDGHHKAETRAEFTLISNANAEMVDEASSVLSWHVTPDTDPAQYEADVADKHFKGAGPDLNSVNITLTPPLSNAPNYMYYVGWDLNEDGELGGGERSADIQVLSMALDVLYLEVGTDEHWDWLEAEDGPNQGVVQPLWLGTPIVDINLEREADAFFIVDAMNADFLDDKWKKTMEYARWESVGGMAGAAVGLETIDGTFDNVGLPNDFPGTLRLQDLVTATQFDFKVGLDVHLDGDLGDDDIRIAAQSFLYWFNIRVDSDNNGRVREDDDPIEEDPNRPGKWIKTSSYGIEKYDVPLDIYIGRNGMPAGGNWRIDLEGLELMRVVDGNLEVVSAGIFTSIGPIGGPLDADGDGHERMYLKSSYGSEEIADKSVLMHVAALDDGERNTGFPIFDDEPHDDDVPEKVYLTGYDPEANLDLIIQPSNTLFPTLEESIPRFVPINDAYNADASPDGTILPADTDLIPARITFSSNSTGILRHDAPDNMTFWIEKSDINPYISTLQGPMVESGDYYRFDGDVGIRMKSLSGLLGIFDILIEGHEPTPNGQDHLVTAWYVYDEDGKTLDADSALLIVSDVDLDVDSDYTNGLNLPDRSDEEEVLEEDITEQGKVVYQSDSLSERYTPLYLSKLAVQASTDNGKIKLTYNQYDELDPTTGGPLEIYALDGTTRLDSGVEYLLSDVTITSGQNDTLLWIKVVDNSQTEATEQILVEIDPDGEAVSPGAQGIEGYIFKDYVHVLPRFDAAAAAIYSHEDPLYRSVISSDTVVLGSVIDTHGDLTGWRLQLVPISVPEGAGEDPVVITTSTTEAVGDATNPAVLGTIPTDLLDDGIYQLQLITTSFEKDENGVMVPDFDRGRVLPGHRIQVQDGLHQNGFVHTESDIVIDVPGLPSIGLGRYYDSSEAGDGVDNGLGIGWSLGMPEVRISRIAELVDAEEIPVGLRAGDIITALIPGKGALSFAFAPKVIDDTTPGEEIWEPQFVSIDGSGSVLGFNWDDTSYQLIALDGEFFVQELTGLQRTIAYDPADSELAGSYVISTVDDWTYQVDFTSGLITSATDLSGNTITYSESGISAGNQTIHIERDADTGQVLWVSTDPTGVEPKVVFGYDQASGELLTVTDREGRTTYYTYGSNSRLISVKDSDGVEQIAVDYESDGRVNSIDRLATNDEIGVVPEGAEHVYNERRELERIIQAQYDDMGAVTGYTVVAFTYEYADLQDDDFEPVYRTFDHEGVTYSYTETATIQTTKQTAWLPFEIDGVDPDGLRYTQAPEVKTGEMTLRAWPSGFDGSDLTQLDHLGLPTQQAVLAPDGKTWLADTAEYEHFTSQATQVTDAYGNTIFSTYDAAGNLIEEKRVAPDGTTVLEHLKHVYTAEGMSNYTYVLDGTTADVSDLASGLWLETVRVLDEVSLAEVSLGRNVYYDATAALGSVGRLQSETDREGVSTRHTYWANGNVKETFREWDENGSSPSVRQSYTEYNAENQVTLFENVFGDQTRYYYDGIGRRIGVEDRFGGFTLSTYDARGNLIRRLTPAGIETRWAYNDDNLLTHVSESFATQSVVLVSPQGDDLDLTWFTGNSGELGNDATYVVTEYLYDSLDRQIGTVRHENASIQIALDTDPVVDGSIAPAGLQIFETAADLTGSSVLYTTSTHYDAAGRVNESVSATGLRRGTIYNDAGYAVVSGVLKDTAPDPESGTPLTLADFETYNQFRYDQWNQDKIVLDGVAEVDDVLTLTFLNRQGDQSTTISVTTVTPANLMSDLAAAINASSDPLVQQVTNAVVDVDGNIQLTLDAAADFLLTADITDDDGEGDAPLVYADGDTRSTWNSDTNGHTRLDIMNEQGQVVKTVYHDGSFVETPVDTLGKPISRADLDTPTAIPTTELDGAHAVTTVQRKDTDPVLAQHTLYDGSGNISDVWLPEVNDPVASSPTYNTLVRPHYQYEYDVRGNITAITDPNQNRTEFTYDFLGRQTSRTLPIGVATTADSTDFIETRHFFDSSISGWPFDPALSVGSGQLEYDVDFEGRVTAYRYDNTATGRGRLVGKFYYDTQADYLADINTLTAADRTVTYAYNAFGQMTQVNDSGHGSGGGTTNYAYDSQKRLTQVASPEGILNYGYNDLGQTTRVWTSKTTAADDPFTDIRYTYDTYGRLETVLTAERADIPTLPGDVDLDGDVDNADAAVIIGNNGQTSGMTLADGDTDGDGNVDSDDVDNFTANFGNDNSLLLTTYFYDGVGNLDAMTVGDGTNITTTDYQYDSLNRLENLYHFNDLNNDDTDYDAVDDALIAGFEYTLDSRGNRIASTETVDDGTTVHTYNYTWTYDDANRLIGEELDASNNALDYTDTYTYDLAGNRIGKTHDQLSDGSIDLTSTYGYDANDRLVIEQGFSSNGSTLETTTVYAYGDNPNYTFGSLYGGDGTDRTEKTTRIGAFTSGANFVTKQTFAYGVNGRVETLTTYTNGSTTADTTTTFTYDDTGLRVSESDGTDTKDYLFDRRNHTGFAQVLEAYVNDQLEKVFQIGHDVISQADVSDPLAQEVLTLLSDGHGSTRGLIDQLGDLVQQYAYDAYGNMLSGTGLTTADAALTNLLYSGEWTLADGQQYLRARLYDPASGTFNRLDPFFGNLSDPQSLHKYLYTHANPVAFSDPSGESVLGYFFGTASRAFGSASIALGALDVGAALSAAIVEMRDYGYLSNATEARLLVSVALYVVDVALFLLEGRIPPGGGIGFGGRQYAMIGGATFGVTGVTVRMTDVALARALGFGLLHLALFSSSGGFPDNPNSGRGGNNSGGGSDTGNGSNGGGNGNNGNGSNGGTNDGPGGGGTGAGGPGGGRAPLTDLMDDIANSNLPPQQKLQLIREAVQELIQRGAISNFDEIPQAIKGTQNGSDVLGAFRGAPQGPTGNEPLLIITQDGRMWRGSTGDHLIPDPVNPNQFQINPNPSRPMTPYGQ